MTLNMTVHVYQRLYCTCISETLLYMYIRDFTVHVYQRLYCTCISETLLYTCMQVGMKHRACICPRASLTARLGCTHNATRDDACRARARARLACTSRWIRVRVVPASASFALHSEFDLRDPPTVPDQVGVPWCTVSSSTTRELSSCLFWKAKVHACYFRMRNCRPTDASK